MDKKLLIISTCTNDKSHIPEDTCLLDSCIKRTYTASIREWLKRLNNCNSQKYPAIKLYKGSHWKETRACMKTTQDKGFRPELWILSAGWGLVHSDDKICSYSATFSNGKNSIQNLPWPDEFSIKDRSRFWWKAITQANKEQFQLSQIPSKYKNSGNLCMLFILSKEYYQAIEPEIIKLISKGIEVIIISAGLYSEIGSASPVVKDHILPFNNKFKQICKYLNHTNTSLNARLANWLIEKHCKDLIKGLPSLYKVIKNIEQSLPEIKKKNIIRMTDDEVLDFIDENYEPDSSSATKLLKVLRHIEKKSCEQKRFGKLYKRYVKNYFKGGLFNA